MRRAVSDAIGFEKKPCEGGIFSQLSWPENGLWHLRGSMWDFEPTGPRELNKEEICLSQMRGGVGEDMSV